jgi:hypothetical protein
MNRLTALLLFPFIFLFAFSACKTDNRKNVSRGFYFWKSKFQLTDKDQKLLASLDANKVYVKFFDVDWDEYNYEPAPYATLQPSGVLQPGIKIVPTIFISNRTFENMAGESHIQNLKANLYKKVTQLLNCFDSEVVLDEIQIDCDWNESTKDRYFSFLKMLKEEMGKNIKLSATIRLHQVKYFQKTGVPPVDRGMLMFYNMGQVDQLKAENSIFNTAEASKYLTQFDTYPLPLDVALPVFSWAAIYRQQKLVQLISDFEPTLLGNKNLVKVGNDTYQAKGPIEMKTYYLQTGDVVKFEVMQPENTLEAAELIQSHMKDSISVILFDYNDINLKRYHEEDLKDIFDTFN